MSSMASKLAWATICMTCREFLCPYPGKPALPVPGTVGAGAVKPFAKSEVAATTLGGSGAGEGNLDELKLDSYRGLSRVPTMAK